MKFSARKLCVLLAAVAGAAVGWGQQRPPPKTGDLADYRTVDKAITTKISKAASAAGLPGHLGVSVVQSNEGRVTVAHVQPDSPAANAGVREGDALLEMGGQSVKSVAMFRELLLGRVPGETVPLRLSHNGEDMTLQVTLGAGSRPMKLSEKRGVLGLQATEAPDGVGAVIKSIAPGQPADRAGLKQGEIIVKIDGQNIATATGVNDHLADKQPGDLVTVTVRRDGKDHDVKVALASDKVFEAKIGGWDNRAAFIWKKNTFRLAVIPIDFSDVKHNAKITAKNWEEALFSEKTYHQKSVTGQKVYGSLRDYYQEQSFGRLRVHGKVFDVVEVAKKRGDYGQSTSPFAKTILLGETLDHLFQRDGKDALQGFDGIFFIYAGERVPTNNRGSLYWPHRGAFFHHGKLWSYLISAEGGAAMSNISIICHEFGHMLGLPDLYARPENPGSEGVGVWCAMSNQVNNGRPQHFCAWSKERMGWIQTAVIDPTVKQKLVLAPIADSPKECIKVLVKLDGSEYFLLENRRKKGFDHELPAEGLLIWRVVQGKPMLEEAHGVEGPAGPRVFLHSVPYPSAANDAFTPFTAPSSRAQLGGGLPVWITNIRRLPDERITFWIGYEFL